MHHMTVYCPCLGYSPFPIDRLNLARRTFMAWGIFICIFLFYGLISCKNRKLGTMASQIPINDQSWQTSRDVRYLFGVLCPGWGHRQCSVNRAPQMYFISGVIPVSYAWRGGCDNPGLTTTSLVMLLTSRKVFLIPEPSFLDRKLLYLSSSAGCQVQEYTCWHVFTNLIYVICI